MCVFSASLLFGEIYSAKISCIKCSTADDTNCSRANLEPSLCSQEDDQCFMRVLNGQLVRGCYQDQSQIDQASCDANEGLCIKCQEDGCNKRYWPKCYSCVENADVGCENEQTDLTKASYCSVYSSDNYCLASVNNDIVFRGCASDYVACLSNRATCQMCHSDGCNGLSKANLKTSKCQKCHSSEENCIIGNSTAMSSDCSRLADPCFSAVVDNKVQRGCLDFSPNPRLCSDPSDATCVACQGDNCNAESWLRCHQCKVTATDESCKEEKADLASATFCRNHQANDKCYSRTVNGIFERGCQSDLGTNVNACDQLSENDCQLCTDAGCNKQRNAAGQLLINSIALVMSVVVAGISVL